MAFSGRSCRYSRVLDEGRNNQVVGKAIPQLAIGVQARGPKGTIRLDETSVMTARGDGQQLPATTIF